MTYIPPVIMWFRSDLRLNDNTALNHALKTGAPVLCVFVLDPVIIAGRNNGAFRLLFLRRALESLARALKDHGGNLVIRYGNPVQELASVIEETGASALYFNRDYSPYARHRDGLVEAHLPIPIYSFDDALLVTPDELTKQDGTPYKVFTPFKKQWLLLPKPIPEAVAPSGGQFHIHPFDGVDLNRLIPDNGLALPDANPAEAGRLLSQFADHTIYHYVSGRDHLSINPTHDDDLQTSFLSPYLHLGLLSIREVYWTADRAGAQMQDDLSRKGVETWISELAWREFYRHILFHFPHVATDDFRPIYRQMAWRHAPDELQAWKDGLTGYPIVDAAMRQLKQIGWMPNRARMIVASFLTKDLMIDWREGERHFMQWLIDGDLASNNGGWQWSAGTGTDAQPFFRIFNPISQSHKFDRDGAYIRHWLPELSAVPSQWIHAPWLMEQPPADYPAPIVDHGFARERALEAFKKLKS